MNTPHPGPVPQTAQQGQPVPAAPQPAHQGQPVKAAVGRTTVIADGGF
ncbi:hypothetical protein ACFRFL_19685 [Streptomyces sp. NPDC056708]